MRCIKCNVDTKLKRLKETHQRCPGCGHKFVADKKTHGITDQGIQKALEKVSAKGTQFYLTGHLHSELRQRLGVGTPRSRTATVLGFLMPLGLIGIGLYLFFQGAIFFLSGIFFASGLIWLIRSIKGSFGGMTKEALSTLIADFERTNPPDFVVPAEADIAQQMAEHHQQGPHPNIESVLVCQHRQLVDFFCANKFYLHHPGAVIGPDGYGLDFYPGLLERLRSADRKYQILVLHDFSPRGNAFLGAIQANPDWLQFPAGTEVIDIGLNESQRDMFKKSLRPVEDFDQAGPRSRSSPARRESSELGAEVFVIAPLLMFTAAGAAMDEGVLMHFPEQHESRDGGG